MCFLFPPKITIQGTTGSLRMGLRLELECATILFLWIMWKIFILYKYPVPILDKEDMEKIDEMVKEAHHKQHIANNNIRLSIQMIEQDVEKWNK